MIKVLQTQIDGRDAAMVEMSGSLSEQVVDVALAIERIRVAYAFTPSSLYDLVEFARSNLHAHFVEAPTGIMH